MTNRHRIARGQKCFPSGRWLILLALVVLVISSLGCSLGGRLKSLPLVEGSRQTTAVRNQVLATYTPWPIVAIGET